MTELQFDKLIENALEYLGEDCKRHPERYKQSGEAFEPCVKDAVDYAIEKLSLEVVVDYTPGGHGFPDIVIEDTCGNKYGIEVKSSSSKGQQWRINGNSVLGKTRTAGIGKTVIVFGKVRGEHSLFRAKQYDKSIASVVVTHSPRYLIDLDIEEGESFFEQSKLEYDEINQSNDPIKLITDYFVSMGQKAWWLADSTPAAIRMFCKLEKAEQNELIGYAFAHFVEIFSNSAAKFYRYMSWLAVEKSIIDSALRDRFTAGGRIDVQLSNKSYSKLPRVFKTLHEFRKYVLLELENADVQILENDWGIVPKEDLQERIEQWITIASENIIDECFKHVEIKQVLKDILLDEEQ